MEWQGCSTNLQSVFGLASAGILIRRLRFQKVVRERLADDDSAFVFRARAGLLRMPMRQELALAARAGLDAADHPSG